MRMENDWTGCKNILVVRADNMGDLLMSSPAIRAVKETLKCKVTVLTSSMGAGIAQFIPSIDDVIVSDLPWVKTDSDFSESDYTALLQSLRAQNFDGAIIFTVYSQSSLPAALLASMAGIPRRLAYCRENPYRLLTAWIADKEPYSFIRHQVRRDLDLVAYINCQPEDEQLRLKTSPSVRQSLLQKLTPLNLTENKLWIVLHAGVSEEKRKYPIAEWIEAGKLLLKEFPCRLLVTGNSAEKSLTDKIANSIGHGAHALAGKINLEEFIALIREAALVISVNTATIHIASATCSPLVVLYALTNPQHTPWMARGELLPFKIPDFLASKNEVIKFVNKSLLNCEVTFPSPADILEAAKRILYEKKISIIPQNLLSESQNA